MSLAEDLVTLRSIVQAMPGKQCADPECVACKRQLAEKEEAAQAFVRVEAALAGKAA